MKLPSMSRPAFDRALAEGDSLAVQLDYYAKALLERRPEVADAYQNLIETLNRGEAGAKAPKDGDPLPPFLLPDECGRFVSSAELVSAGPLVVSFNRGAWCTFCWLELSALGERHRQIRRRGGAIVAITPETAVYGRALKERLGLDFPMLSDLDNAYALELGLAVALSPQIKEIFHAAGTDLGIYQKNDAWFVPIPATLLVDRQGIVRKSYVNADFRLRLDPAEILEAISDLG